MSEFFQYMGLFMETVDNVIDKYLDEWKSSSFGVFSNNSLFSSICSFWLWFLPELGKQ